MPRDIEHIVSCHDAASALRAAGKPIWARTVAIKELLAGVQDRDSPEQIAAVSKQIAQSLRAQLPAQVFDSTRPDYDFDFIDAVEMMEECTAAELSEGCPADQFDEWLTAVYDWADRNRVWVG